jgi:Protein of unknown function (DUF1329)
MHVRSLAMAALLAASPLAGALTPEEAKQLGTTLTEIGAEKAGNADGSIPPYTGGLTTPPPSYRPGSGSRPDPFAGEKPLFSIDPRNADRYADRLTEGAKALLRRYPDFRIDVYPAHRTVAFPRFVTENTVRLATSAHLTNDGLSFAGARAAYPFPIPKSGNEAMWNHLLRFTAVCDRRKISAYHVESSGAVTLSAQSQMLESYPYWDARAPDANVYFRLRVRYEGPPRRAGEAMMLIDPVDYVQRGRRGWQYLPGQRRVRLAPDLAYDTPNTATAGAQTFDDALLFNGKMDRFDFTLVGKREIYVPYNLYRAVYEATPEQLFRPRFLSPDLVRWELHRVWVVEAKLKPGKRHTYSRRVFYLDEDSWAALLSDQYDSRGGLYRVGMAFMAPSYDVPAPWPDPFLHYDLVTGVYAINGWPGASGWLRHIECPSENEWSPDALAGAGVR